MLIMVRSMAAGRDAAGAVAESLHLMREREREWTFETSKPTTRHTSCSEAIPPNTSQTVPPTQDEAYEPMGTIPIQTTTYKESRVGASAFLCSS